MSKQKIKMAMANSNADTDCPYCKGESEHTKSQRPACKKKQQASVAR